MVKVFISYRREDSQYQTDRLYDLLSNYVDDPAKDIFLDVDNIPYGVDFVEHLEGKVSECEMVLAVIGKNWITVKDPETGERRLENPNDFIRIEIATALKRGIPVVPVLLDGAPVPRPEQLPEDMKALSRRNGVIVNRMSFSADVETLVNGLPISLRPLPTESSSEGSPVLADLRETWVNFPARENPDAVARFLARVAGAAPGSGLEFEVEHHLDELRRAADALERKEWEERLGPVAAHAALAAKAGKPVAERVFPVRLEGVSGWPTPQMVVIPPGRFLMGAPVGEEGSGDAERPQHEVRIDYPFALGQHSVTFAEWDAACAAGARLEKPDDQGWGRNRRPVINVSWDDAQAYLAWLNERLGLAGRGDAYRLPSEAEWEYACRAGTETPFSVGKTITPDKANYHGNYTYGGGPKGTYHEKTMPVGSYPANAFGLFDMHGNVWEWCADPGHETYQGAPTDGSVCEGGDASLRVLRGGSWYFIPQFLRSAYRYWFNPSLRFNYIGFRVARTL